MVQYFRKDLFTFDSIYPLIVYGMIFKYIQSYTLQHSKKILMFIIFTDDSQFIRKTVLNSNCYQMWAEYNSYGTRMRLPISVLSVNVWACIIGSRLIVLYILTSQLSSNYCLEFLEKNFADFVEEVPLNQRNIPTRMMIVRHNRGGGLQNL